MEKVFYGTVSYEHSKTQTKINVIATGKEQAIDKIMEKMFKIDFRRYMRIEKVEVIEGLS
jgi:hypothetical protein